MRMRRYDREARARAWSLAHKKTKQEDEKDDNTIYVNVFVLETEVLIS